ncbi:hypothetical protein GEMRC1_002294 [Eukaryota sp. GEM-RC1]
MVSIRGKPGTHQIVAVSPGLSSAHFLLTGGDCEEGQGLNGQGCFDCPPGTKSVDFECVPCPIGEWSWSSRSTQCSPCMPGTKRNLNDTGCVSCRLKEIAPDIGSTECSSCPTRFSGNDDLTECVCDGNLYFVDGECIECPTGLLCEAYNRFCVLPGFYQANDGSVFPCKKSGCLGNCTKPSDCSEGFTGPLCTHCEEGFYSQGNLCSECPSSIVIFGVIAAQVVVYASLVPLLRLEKKRKFESLQFYLPLIRFIQVLCGIRTITAIPLPSAVHSVLDVLDLVVLRPWGAPITACAGLPSGFYSLYWSSAVLLPGILGLGFLLSQIEVSSVMYQIFFAVPAFNVLSVFSCRSIESATSSFSPFYNDLDCGSGLWLMKFILAVCFLLLFVIVNFLLVFTNKKNPFTVSITSKFYIDEVLAQLHLILILGGLFTLESVGAMTQSVAGFLICMVAFAVNSKRHPMSTPRAHSLQSTYFITEAVLFMLVFVRTVDVVNAADFFINSCLVVIGLVILVSIVMCLCSFVFGSVERIKFRKNNFMTNLLQKSHCKPKCQLSFIVFLV